MGTPYSWRHKTQRRPLPIDSRLQEILDLHHNHQVIIVQADTGAGKTLRIGQAIVDSDPNSKVVLTQSRRNAVRSNGRQIAKEMGENLGQTVGIRLAREDPVVSDQTRLLLRIDQAVCNNIRVNGGRLPEGTLIIDEAHERSISIDVLLKMIKRSLPDSPNTRIIITSATIDTEKFSRYFDDAPVVQVEGRCFPVSTEIVHLYNSEHHSQGAVRAATTVADRFRKGELAIPAETGVSTIAVRGGSVLVLLPGKEDINQAMLSINTYIQENNLSEAVEVISCHGESTADEQDRALVEAKPGKLRFVIGTEILRSSVTIPGTIGTIDSLQIKRRYSDAQGVAHLGKIGVSRDLADQAKGRSGRTNPGFYMPVSFGYEYEHLEPYTAPAILREPIVHIALQVAALGQSIRDKDFIDNPDEQKVEIAIKRLKLIGAIDENEQITDSGRELLRFPIDPEKAYSLVVADRLGVLPEALITVAALDSEGIFFRPKNNFEPITVGEDVVRLVMTRYKYKAKYSFAPDTKEWIQSDTAVCLPEEVDLSALPEWITPKGDGAFIIDPRNFYAEGLGGSHWIADLLRDNWAGDSQSDFVSVVGAYRAYKAEQRRLRHTEPRLNHREVEDGLWQWCKSRFINRKRMMIMKAKVDEIRDELRDSPLLLNGGVDQPRDFNPESLTVAIASGHVDHISVSSGGECKGPLGKFSIAREAACPRNAPLIVIGGVRKIPGRRAGQDWVLGEFGAEVKVEWLPQIMPQLYHRELLNDHIYESTEDGVVQTELTTFNGMEVSERKTPVAKCTESEDAFCEWVVGLHLGHGYTPNILRSVIDHNNSIRSQARELNTRAGQQIFPATNHDELFTFLRAGLCGAVSVKTLPETDRLYLDPLESELVNLIEEENPNNIEINGVEYTVQYPTNADPLINIEFGKTDEWANLPNEGLRLPGGRAISVKVSDGWRWSETGSDLSILREATSQYLRAKLFHEWQSLSTKPDIAPPSLSSPSVTIPLIRVEFGTDPVSGEILIAHGTLVAKSDSEIDYAIRYDSDPQSLFSTRWFLSEGDALQAQQRTAAVAERVHLIVANKELKTELLVQAQNLQSEIQDVQRKYREIISYKTASSIPYTVPDNRSTIEDIQTWLDKNNGFLARLKTEIQDTIDKILEKDRILREAAIPIPALRSDSSSDLFGSPTTDGDGGVEWHLYSEGQTTYGQTILVPYKGFRSQSRGKTFIELVTDYYRGEDGLDRLAAELRANNPETQAIRNEQARIIDTLAIKIDPPEGSPLPKSILIVPVNNRGEISTPTKDGYWSAFILESVGSGRKVCKYRQSNGAVITAESPEEVFDVLFDNLNDDAYWELRDRHFPPNDNPAEAVPSEEPLSPDQLADAVAELRAKFGRS